MKTVFAAAFATSLIVAGTRVVAAPPNYQIVAIAPLPGYTQSAANGINIGGTVVGTASNAALFGAPTSAFTWTARNAPVMLAPALLAMPKNAVATRAWAVDDNGLVVGDTVLANGKSFVATEWAPPNAAVRLLGTLVPAGSALLPQSSAVAVRQSSPVGSSQTAAAQTHAAMFNGPNDLAPGNALSEALAVDRFAVVGDATPRRARFRVAAMFSPQGPQFLPQLAGGRTSIARGVVVLPKQELQIVGESESFVPPPRTSYAVSWTSSYNRNGLQNPIAMRNLGTLPGDTSSRAIAVNHCGVIVGLSMGAAGLPRAFVVDANNVMVDLATLLPAGSKWKLTSVAAINDMGQIVGTGLDPALHVRGFVLMPNPPQAASC